MKTTETNTKEREMRDTRLNEKDGVWTATADGKTATGESITVACRKLARKLRVGMECLTVTTEITHE